MSTDVSIYEFALLEYVKKIKEFNNQLIDKYKLKDSPYNVSGKLFPKIDTITNEFGKTISYRFHGRGATFWDDNIEVQFSVDTSSKYQIIISVGGFYCFLKTFLNNYDEGFPLENLMEEFESKGIFIRRKSSDLGTFHVNETWYTAKTRGDLFKGQNKNDIDW